MPMKDASPILSAMRAPSNALIRLSQVALVVLGIDLASKALSSRWLGDEAVSILPWVDLHVVHNLSGAFGWSAGAYTWQLNLALTMCAVIFVFPVARDLARVDASSPTGLGLIVGGAMGNLLSLLAPPAGVADFIAIHPAPGHGIVLNLADLAAYGGLALIARTGFRIVAAIREEARVAARQRLGSLYAAKDAIRGRTATRHRETVVRDWSNVADLGVVHADGRGADRVPRPMGAEPRVRVRLIDGNTALPPDSPAPIIGNIADR